MMYDLRDSERNWILDNKGISRHCIDYFINLFTCESCANPEQVEEFIRSIDIPRLLEDHLKELNQPFTNMEIEF